MNVLGPGPKTPDSKRGAWCVPGGESRQAVAAGAQGRCAQERWRGAAQTGPRHAAPHAHENPPAASRHVPPCRHGADWHSSMSCSQLQAQRHPHVTTHTDRSFHNTDQNDPVFYKKNLSYIVLYSYLTLRAA